jgi:hypothetical protein
MPLVIPLNGSITILEGPVVPVAMEIKGGKGIPEALTGNNRATPIRIGSGKVGL